MLLVRFQLEYFLVECGRLGEKSLFAQAVGDADELLDRSIGFRGADVEIAEHVGRVPVARIVLYHAYVLRDCGVDLPLPQEFLSVPERCRAVDGHGVRVSQWYQTGSEGGTIAGALPSIRSVRPP